MKGGDKMKYRVTFLDFQYNIDTLCFKIEAKLPKSCFEKWETDNYVYHQTERSINKTDVSIRYYPGYECLSILIDSVPALLYGSSQKMFNKKDYRKLMKKIARLVNSATGLFGFRGLNKYSFDNAFIVRVDINHDFYFTKENNEMKFRNWLGKFRLPYSKNSIVGNCYSSGGKTTTNSVNLTYYSKNIQCDQKHKDYDNSISDYCTRVEFQFKSGYFHSQEPVKLKDFIMDDGAKIDLVKKLLIKLRLNGEIKNQNTFKTFLRRICKSSRRSDFRLNTIIYFGDLQRYGFNDNKIPMKYEYLKIAKENNVVPIWLDKDVYRDLQANKNYIL